MIELHLRGLLGEPLVLVAARDMGQFSAPHTVVEHPTMRFELAGVSEFALAEFVAEVSGQSFTPGDPRVLEWIEAEFAAGSLGKLRLLRLPFTPIVASTSVDEDVPFLSELSEAIVAQSWIALRLLGLDAQPLADVDYELTLYDETVENGATDGDGEARHDGIVEGGCSVGFLGLGPELWELSNASGQAPGTTGESVRRITRRTRTRNFGVRSGALHVFQLAPLVGQVLEMEDVHFHHDSAVLLPDFGPCDPSLPPTRHITGLAVVATCLKHAEAHPDEKLLSAGHTDSSGPDAYNITLSHKRADNVAAVVRGDKDEWVQIALDQSKVEDYQQILTWVAWIWGWPCNPQGIDGDHGSNTDAAVEAFQRLSAAEFDRDLSVDGDVGEQTWGAIFDVYQRILADVLELDADGLRGCQDAVKWLDTPTVGCGESFPIEQRGLDNYRSETNRRVELVFFEPGEEPALACHPAPGQCDKDKCDLYNTAGYHLRYLPCVPIELVPRTLRVELVDVAGLYKPGYDDPADVTNGTTKASGYELGYTSDDDKGRIFVNHIPRADASVTWESIREKDTQYIELEVTVVASDGRDVPAGTRVQWTWEDPDDPSNAVMHAHASGLVDPNDSGLDPSKDNLGDRDWPQPADGNVPKYEGVDPYGAEEVDANTATSAVRDGRSRIRLHCTSVGGDNYRVTAQLWQHQLVVPGASDATGLMTMWKRIDLEYRKMVGAHPLPVDGLPPVYETCFVQLDVTTEQSSPRLDSLSPTDATFDAASSKYVKKPPAGVFVNESKPGWFLLVAAHRAVASVAAATRSTIYTGPATIDEFQFSDGSRAERIVINGALSEDPVAVRVTEGSNRMTFFAYAKDDDTPNPGQTSIYVVASDYQSDFEPGDGRIYGPGGSYETSNDRYLQHSWNTPAKTWTTPGLGFPDDIEIEVIAGRGGETGGVSPTNTVAGREYFAGRTIIFTKHPSYNDKDGKPLTADLLSTITHELGHAFGFPHKCGYYTWQDPPSFSCCMNYFNTWLYEPGTRNLRRFDTGTEGKHFCARHLHGIRRVHLEDNPSLWTWT